MTKVNLSEYTPDEQRSIIKTELTRCLNKGDDLINAIARVSGDYPMELVDEVASTMDDDIDDEIAGKFDDPDPA